jgi:KDO2-lipid IV(A) lauroyltransferase
MVERHLRRTAGRDLDPAELSLLTRNVFDSYARYWLESFRLPVTTRAELEAGISFEGVDHVDRALAAGNGAIAAMPHLGGWDFGGAFLASVGYPATVVVEAIEPPELFEWFASLRQSHGLTVVPHGRDAGTAVLKALRANGLVGLVCDRDLDRRGIEVDFFGERTTLPAGPATLALRTGAAILPTAVYFEGPSHRGVIGAPIEFERTGKLRADVATLTQLLAVELERMIGRAPDQWHVLQPNWPDDYALRLPLAGRCG